MNILQRLLTKCRAISYLFLGDEQHVHIKPETCSTCLFSNHTAEYCYKTHKPVLYRMDACSQYRRSR